MIKYDIKNTLYSYFLKVFRKLVKLILVLFSIKLIFSSFISFIKKYSNLKSKLLILCPTLLEKKYLYFNYLPNLKNIFIIEQFPEK
jgi:hypothetical protein